MDLGWSFINDQQRRKEKLRIHNIQVIRVVLPVVVAIIFPEMYGLYAANSTTVFGFNFFRSVCLQIYLLDLNKTYVKKYDGSNSLQKEFMN